MARGIRTIVGTLFLILVLLGASLLFFRSSSPPDSSDPPPVGATPKEEQPAPAPDPAPAPPPPAQAQAESPPAAAGGADGIGSDGLKGVSGVTKSVNPPAAPAMPPAAPERITDRFDEVDAALGQLVAGNVAFNTPERMRLGESRTVALVASPTLNAETLSGELRNRIGGADPIEIEALQIAPLMETQLEGAPAFGVTTLTPTRQPVSRAAPTEWRWSVRANQTGKHALHLTINAVITVAGESYPRSIDVLSRDIVVDVTAAQRIGMFLERNWQWVLGSVMFPLAAWLWSHRRKQTRKARNVAQ